MLFFRLREWWKYWRAAKSRHGIHSPFVYLLIDQGLRTPLPKAVREQLRRESSTSYQYRQASTIYRVTTFLREAYSMSPVALEESNDSILKAFADKAFTLKEGPYLLVKDIHKTPKNAAVWKKLSADNRVNLSIDLWYIGLLFYRPDFKEKQHFILKHQS
jgi:hypothetical protein